MGKSTCQQCGKSWGGLRAEHCKACHETFAGTAPGDAHRVGKHAISVGLDRRRCRSVEEMLESEFWRDGRGVWHRGARRPAGTYAPGEADQ